MRVVVVAVIERHDRRILIGQRRKSDSSPLKWEFPGGKVEENERPEDALRRELREELGVELHRCAEITRVVHRYVHSNEPLEIRFYAASIAGPEPEPRTFEAITWALPRELASYDFLAANAPLIALLATGKIKPAQFLEKAAHS